MYVNMVTSVHIESPVGGAVVLSGKTMKLHFTFKLICQLPMLDFIFYILLTSLKTSEQISKHSDRTVGIYLVSLLPEKMSKTYIIVNNRR